MNKQEVITEIGLRGVIDLSKITKTPTEGEWYHSILYNHLDYYDASYRIAIYWIDRKNPPTDTNDVYFIDYILHGIYVDALDTTWLLTCINALPFVVTPMRVVTFDSRPVNATVKID